MFTDFLQNCIDGLMVGSGYALLALGFTMVFGVMKRLNLSYGPSIMLGAYVGTWLYLNVEQNAWLVLFGTIAGTIVVGIYVERLCFRSISRDSTIASMVSSFVIWMQLEEIAMHLLPERTYPFPAFFTTTRFELGAQEELSCVRVAIVVRGFDKIAALGQVAGYSSNDADGIRTGDSKNEGMFGITHSVILTALPGPGQPYLSR